MAAVLLIGILHNNNNPFLLDIFLALIIAPSVVFVGVVLYKSLKMLGVIGKIRNIVCGFRKARNSVDGDEPHRMINPTQYSPLL